MRTETNRESVGVIVLTGGASRRFGADKATAQVHGVSLLEHVLADVPAGVPVLVCGPALPGLPSGVGTVQEEPPGGGPVAGLLAAAMVADADVCGVVATDMPLATEAVLSVAGDHAREWRQTGGPQALIPDDASGRRQPLGGSYSTAALRTVQEHSGGGHGMSMGWLLDQLDWRTAPLSPTRARRLFDIDTRTDLIAHEDQLLAHDVEGAREGC